MTADNMDIGEAARLWAIRVQDSAFDDWDGLTDWLEQDAAHAAAYDAAVADADWAAELYRLAPPPARIAAIPAPRAAPPRRRWYMAGGAIAAALVGVATFTMMGQGARHEYITAPGEHRTVPLADGSRIILNGGTRITLDPDAPREVTLASGEALFDVKHDESRPFVVHVGKTRLLDVGTVFNVTSDDGALDVAVSEGAVIYEPDSAAIRLDAGNALSRPSASASPVLRKTGAREVGGWQSGRLEYADAALDRVARDLGRNLGHRIVPAAGAERLRFTGTLKIDGPAQDVLSRTAPLLGVRFTPDGKAWRMTPADGAPPF